MNKFASELVMKPVVVKDAIVHGESALVGVVENLIINPDDGTLAGLLVREGVGKQGLKTLSAKDIIGISSEFYLIPSYTSLGDLDEIVRLKEIIDREISIIGNKVYTASGTYLGKVFDYTLDLKHFILTRVYVRSVGLMGMGRQHIISYNQIISIEKEKIIVDDNFAKAKKSTLVQAENTATA